ncbi:MAG: ThiF family adenylyltransferase [Phycisphaerae bacterium]|nr:ThiF family adenylyltransferase [Phycisphaerae bacterium]
MEQNPLFATLEINRRPRRGDAVPYVPLHVTDSADRYSRQEILPGIGKGGQELLGRSHAVVIGCGALGCGVIDQLARAGVGKLTIVDRDVVEWSNLQRQTLFDEEDARTGQPKAVAARRRAIAINSTLAISAHIADLTHENAESLIIAHAKPDLILDGTDNLETRYLLNDLAVKHGIPLVYGGVIARRGMQMTIRPGRGPCLRCVFPEPSSNGEAETCDTAGVLGAAVAIVSSLQAAAGIELVVNPDRETKPCLIEFDLASTRFRTIDLSAYSDSASRAECICCAKRRYEFLSGERTRPAATLCGRGSFQIPAAGSRIDLSRLASKVAPVAPVTANEFFVRIAPRPGVEMTVFADARAVVRGTANEGEARALYDRYVGA